jgi:GT2 family glycosyltransferase
MLSTAVPTDRPSAPATPVPRIGIVVLNWNNYPDTSRCLRSLGGLEYPSCSVYLVDNGSTDGSLERLLQESPGGPLEVVANGENLGFAAGCNRGIERALTDGCDYVLLLNNDCIVEDKAFLAPAVSLAESDSRCGIVGGKILFWPDRGVIWSTGGFIRFWGSEVHIGHGEADRGQYEGVAPRRFISGALMLVRRRVFETIGLLPDAYFFGKEEWEFSTRAHRAGFALLYQPAFRVWHEASSSHDWADPTYVYNGTLSRILYKRRNHPPLLFGLWMAVFRAYLAVLFPLRAALRRSAFQQAVPLRAIHEAMRAAVRDSGRVERITLELLERYRRGHPGVGRTTTGPR